MIVFGQSWFYSCNEVVIGHSGCVRASWVYSGKVVVFVKKWLY